MARLSKLRQWINRDDGRLYQADNRNLGALEAIGLFLVPVAAFSWFLHTKFGISSLWAFGLGFCSGLLLVISWIRSPRDHDA
jgi:hypothetical protein